MRWLFHPTKGDHVNDVSRSAAVGTEQQPVSDITHCDEVSTSDASVLYLLELLPICERESDIQARVARPGLRPNTCPRSMSRAMAPTRK